MTNHIRRQVREAAVADLTGLPTTGANVFTSRVAPLTADEMPGIIVAIHGESSNWDAIGTLARTGQLVVEGWLLGGENELDQVAAEVEAKLYGATPALNALLMNIGAPTTALELPEPGEGGARKLARIQMLFPVTYRTPQGDPTTKA